MASDKVLHLTDSSFDREVIQSDIPALVDFWAEWCMPCQMLAPTLEELAEEYDGKVKFGKVDVDANRNTTAKFGIQAIPTLILFKGGQVAKKMVGLKTKKDLKAELDALLA